MFNSKQFEMNQIFNDLDCKVSFTTDCWTSPNMIAFMGVTAHYIDNEWNLQACTIDFMNLPGSHSGSTLYEAFVSVLNTFQLKHKVLFN
jgi:hypothetical protein